MNRVQFESELARLTRTFATEQPSELCLSSSDLRGCTACMFSQNLENCVRCTHCRDCTDSSHLSHSTGCVGCHASAYLRDARHCVHSAYLSQCTSCSECTYCFGCVGLAKKDFHILNVPYPRKDYFAIVDALNKELARR